METHEICSSAKAYKVPTFKLLANQMHVFIKDVWSIVENERGIYNQYTSSNITRYQPFQCRAKQNSL
jgi:NADH:ubiquinone oxidoreductase subunit D